MNLSLMISSTDLCLLLSMNSPALEMKLRVSSTFAMLIAAVSGVFCARTEEVNSTHNHSAGKNFKRSVFSNLHKKNERAGFKSLFLTRICTTGFYIFVCDVDQKTILKSQAVGSGPDEA
jgi:hypothetical protein